MNYFSQPLQPTIGKNYGNWEFDLTTNKLSWDLNQYNIYGYSPEEISINDNYFLINTTHSSDLKRITNIINEAVANHNSYNFKRRIIKKNGVTGFAETHAEIIRSGNGAAEKIVGKTIDLEKKELCESYDFNDPQFFNLLYLNYKRTISLEIFRMVFDNTITKDLCQEVFLKAWTNMSTYDPGKGSLYTWLINITRNHCKDYLRSKRFQERKVTFGLEQVQKGVQAHEDKNKGFAAELLKQLCGDQKEIMELLFVYGFTQSEVSKLKSMPLGTVKTRSREAIKILRRLNGILDSYQS